WKIDLFVECGFHLHDQSINLVFSNQRVLQTSAKIPVDSRFSADEMDHFLVANLPVGSNNVLERLGRVEEIVQDCASSCIGDVLTHNFYSVTRVASNRI